MRLMAKSVPGIISKIIEYSNAVGLRPNTHGTGAGDMFVLIFNIAAAIQNNFNLLALKNYLKLMPYVACNGGIDIFQCYAFSFFGVIKRYVIFQSIGSRNVVIIPIFPAPYDTARLISFPGNRFESDRHRPIGNRNIIPDAP